MAEENGRIKKIRLSNGSVYSIFDEGALRLRADNVICTGNNVVDEAILQGHLSITEIDDIPIAQSSEQILCYDKATGNLKTENIRQVLRDIGCVTADVTDEILSLFTVSIIQNS